MMMMMKNKTVTDYPQFESRSDFFSAAGRYSNVWVFCFSLYQSWE